MCLSKYATLDGTDTLLEQEVKTYNRSQTRSVMTNLNYGASMACLVLMSRIILTHSKQKLINTTQQQHLISLIASQLLFVLIGALKSVGNKFLLLLRIKITSGMKIWTDKIQYRCDPQQIKWIQLRFSFFAKILSLYLTLFCMTIF